MRWVKTEAEYTGDHRKNLVVPGNFFHPWNTVASRVVPSYEPAYMQYPHQLAIFIYCLNTG